MRILCSALCVGLLSLSASIASAAGIRGGLETISNGNSVKSRPPPTKSKEAPPLGNSGAESKRPIVHASMPQSASPKQRLLLSQVLMRLTSVAVNFGIRLFFPLLMCVAILSGGHGRLKRHVGEWLRRPFATECLVKALLSMQPCCTISQQVPLYIIYNI